ncbi:MAG: hypothetical protein HUU57_02865 [Bdellovibrio sp.]|nr:hypothetical protein [Bdellovibrio sp.]
MPEIKDYEGKKKTSHANSHPAKKEAPVTKNKNKRRPYSEAKHHDPEVAETLSGTQMKMEDADAINTEAQNEGVAPEHVEPEIIAEAEMVAEGAPAFGDEPSEGHHHETKIHLDFYGSDLIRMKAPKVMELADTVADQWVKDGQFQGLPVGNPLAQIAAAKALRTAKDVEKKLEEKGVIAMAKMGFEFVKSKIEKK